MAQHVTITDDDSTIATSFTIEPATDDTPSRVTSLTLTASNGGGITAADLANIGVTKFATLPYALPSAAASATTAEAGSDSNVADSARSAATLPLPAQQTRAGKPYRRAPADEQLVALIKTHNMQARPVAEQLDVPVSTVKSWINRLRNKGLLPPARKSASKRK